MSLDVYLIKKDAVRIGSGIFIRENGQTKEVSRAEWDALYPNREPMVAGQIESDIVYSANITHNLGRMASQAGLYKPLWQPSALGISKASELIGLLSLGLEDLKSNPDFFKQFNPPNGWGTYDGLIDFVSDYLDACIQYPDAEIEISR